MDGEDAYHTALARLAWKDLWVTVSNARGHTQIVLHGLTGYAEPGQIMAIMGPSGSGKSTLLDALAGRLGRNATQMGEIFLNGYKKKLSYGKAAYVTQEDTLIGTLTVRETISYTASLRLPQSMSPMEMRSIIDETIVEMGLQDCADTPIGNWHLRGLSGGEKRRVSIALEILTRPHLLFLDEPTSGLDSASAFFVTTTLKKLARDGRTIIASIHQPSSEVFALFDSLFLLSGGKTVYFGKAHLAREHFTKAGFPCPPLRNPSDHYLRAINSDFDRVKAIFSSQDAETGDPLERLTSIEVTSILVERYQASEAAIWARWRAEELSRKQAGGLEMHSAGSRATFWIQICTLTRRSFVNMRRDVGYYWLRLAIYIMLTICIGTIYFDVGTNYESIMARAACMSYITGFLTFMSIGGFPSFVEDMKVFSRERLNGHYGVVAFVLGNFFSSLPFLLLISLVSGAICYTMVKLHPGFEHFMYFVLCLFACVTVVESLMMAVASIVPNFLMGIITGAGIQGIFMLVAGFFRFPKDLPKLLWRYPMSYISFHMYALQGMYQNDFAGLYFKAKEARAPPIPGKYILTEMYQIDVRRSKWWDLAILFSMILGYRMVFLLMVKVSEKLQPYVRIVMRKYTLRCMGRTQAALRREITPEPAPPSSPLHLLLTNSPLNSIP